LNAGSVQELLAMTTHVRLIVLADAAALVSDQKDDAAPDDVAHEIELLSLTH
jgi:hypothetical protein